MVVRAIALYVTMLLVPMLVGTLYNTIIKKNEICLVSNWCNGFIIILGLFELFVLPCIFLKVSLNTLTFLFVILLMGLCIISVWLNRDNFKTMIQNGICFPKKIPWCVIVALTIIGYQGYMYVTCMHLDADDAFYVATSVVAVDTNSVFAYNPYTGDLYETLPSRYVLSPFPIFTAFLSNLFGIHATILAHTVLPVVYLLLAYAVVYLIGRKLFKDSEKATLMTAVAAIIAMYFSTSIYTQSSFMLYRIWQGKAVLAAVLLPYIFYLGYRIASERWSSKDWIIVFFTMLACCLVSSMGIMLGAICMGIVGLLNVFIKKDIKVLINPIICCIPNVVLAIVYLLL